MLLYLLTVGFGLSLVLRWFATEASRRSKSIPMWSFIAALGYLVPVVIFFNLYPVLMDGGVNAGNVGTHSLMLNIYSVIVGAICVFLISRPLFSTAPITTIGEQESAEISVRESSEMESEERVICASCRWTGTAWRE